MEKICKNCKHFGYLENIVNSNYGECNCNKFEYGGASEMEETDKLFYSDYEGYDANFMVGENFGCIHWEKKDD